MVTCCTYSNTTSTNVITDSTATNPIEFSSGEWESTFTGYFSEFEEVIEILLYQKYLIIEEYINKIIKLAKWYIVLIFNCFMIRAPCKEIN